MHLLFWRNCCSFELLRGLHVLLLVHQFNFFYFFPLCLGPIQEHCGLLQVRLRFRVVRAFHVPAGAAAQRPRPANTSNIRQRRLADKTHNTHAPAHTRRQRGHTQRKAHSGRRASTKKQRKAR